MIELVCMKIEYLCIHVRIVEQIIHVSTNIDYTNKCQMKLFIPDKVSLRKEEGPIVAYGSMSPL